MPVARCIPCGSPSRRGTAYRLTVEPVGYPASGIICGVAGCMNPAVLWLTAWEAAEFAGGRRVFNAAGRSPKVCLSDLVIGEAADATSRGRAEGSPATSRSAAAVPAEVSLVAAD